MTPVSLELDVKKLFFLSLMFNAALLALSLYLFDQNITLERAVRGSDTALQQSAQSVDQASVANSSQDSLLEAVPEHLDVKALPQDQGFIENNVKPVNGAPLAAVLENYTEDEIKEIIEVHMGGKVLTETPPELLPPAEDIEFHKQLELEERG